MNLNKRKINLNIQMNKIILITMLLISIITLHFDKIENELIDKCSVKCAPCMVSVIHYCERTEKEREWKKSNRNGNSNPLSSSWLSKVDQNHSNHEPFTF